ncbi:MAG TPA: hypothetical protein DCF62_05885 [Porticoccaceae bacterium]|nr:hypothetical protein [Porticoccaceae bacterium]HCO59477.1 hypothetical protein [Porticoccaceae bacterium]
MLLVNRLKSEFFGSGVFVHTLVSGSRNIGKGLFNSQCLTSYLGLLLLAPGLCAHENVLSELDILGAIPSARIASRIEQTTNRAPASVTVIDQELIKASGAQGWVDVFRLVPGFQAYSVNANRPGIAYHGFGEELPSRLEVMVDGRSVYMPVFSTALWDDLGVELEDVDHIEIVRGPSASSQGSNAFLGAVNIVTREPLQDHGLSTGLTWGSRGTRETRFRFNNHLGPLSYRLSLASRHNEGFPGIPASDAGKVDDGRELYQGAFRGTLTPTVVDVLDINLGFVRDRAGLGDADHPDEFIGTRFYSGYQSLEWQHTFPDGDELSAHLYHNSLRVSGSANRGLISELLGVEPALIPLLIGVEDQPFIEGLGSLASERYDFEIEHQLRINDELRGVWGVGARSEYTRSQLLLGHDNKIREEAFRGFAHGEWRPLHGWLFNAGFMIEETFVGTLVSPRLSISRLLSPDHTLRLSVSHGKRAPSIAEANLNQRIEIDGILLDPVIRSDEDLHEEKVTSTELAWSGNFPAMSLMVETSVFLEQARDTLDAYEEPLAVPALFSDEDKVQSNTGEWESKGVELQATYRPSPAALVRLHYTYRDLDSDFVRRLEPEMQLGDFNASRARHAGGLLMNFRWTPSVSTGLTVYHQSKVNWRAGNFIDEFTRVDVHISRSLRLSRYAGELCLVVQNLTEDYSEFNDENVFGSRYFLTFNLELP